MINFMGNDVTADAENEVSAGDAFVIRRWNAAAEFDPMEFSTQLKELNKKSTTPPLFDLLMFVCGFGSIMMLGEIVRYGNPIQGFRHQPAAYWIGAVCCAGWLALFIRKKTRLKKAITSPEFQSMTDRMEEIVTRSKTALGVPDSAIDIDMLSEHFVIKDGMPKHKAYDALNDYLNLSFSAFVQDGCLYLASGAELWEIPLTSLRTMKRLKPRFSFEDWYKDEPYNGKTYKPYKITRNQFGTYFAHCYQIEIADIKGDFYLLIPDYDADAFSKLTGLHPENDK